MSARSRTSEATPSLSTTKGRLGEVLSARSAGSRVPLALARRFFQIAHGSGRERGRGTSYPIRVRRDAYINGECRRADIDLTSLAERLVLTEQRKLAGRASVSKGLVDRRENDEDRRVRLLGFHNRTLRIFAGEAIFEERVNSWLRPEEERMGLDLTCLARYIIR